MKKIFKNTVLIFMVLVFSQCYTEEIVEVTVIPYDAIEQQLAALRDLQKELATAGVDRVNYEAIIAATIQEINDLVPQPPPGVIPFTFYVRLLSAAREAVPIGVTGATLSIDINGVRTTATSDAGGLAVFPDLRKGVYIVHVEVAGFTDVSFVVDLLSNVGSSDGGYVEGEDYNISTVIALYPTTAANGAVTIDGVLHFDPDRSDDLIVSDPGYGIVNYFDNFTDADADPYHQAEYRDETDGGLNFFGQLNLDAREQSWELVTQAVNVYGLVRPNPQDYKIIPVGTPGNIVLAIYEQMFAATTSSATDGSFQLVLPARANVGGGENDFMIQFTEFSGTETYIRVTNNITIPPIPPVNPVITTRNRTVDFVAMYGSLESEGSGVTDFVPGISNSSFDPALVNNFSGTIGTRGANTTLEGLFYFGARTRD